MTSSLSAIDEINSLISVIKQWRYDHSSLVYNGSFFEPSPSQITSIHDQNGVFLVCLFFFIPVNCCLSCY